MKPILIEFNYNSNESLYVQLYKSIRDDIMSGELKGGEKLPSLRSLSKDLNISITTAQLSYNQLLVEGYITSKPQSGYYVAEVSSSKQREQELPFEDASYSEAFIASNPFLCDMECFDFIKWKKCNSKVFNDYSNLLLFESDPQGESLLRNQIAKYVYNARGVKCSPSQIVIGAGTQQITSHLCRILSKVGINHVSLETPGYLPVQSMLQDNGFALSHIPVGKNGIDISKLPINIASAVYVSPSNQFPTGTVMPAGRRHQLLDWATDNNSIIIEDDYDSELRYFGKPVPALKSLDTNNNVVYLGSFSSTLFPAIKISYMVLPDFMSDIFQQIKGQYTQTCSKAEQLTLALFMENGYYQTGIKKMRNLYAQKLSQAMSSFEKYGSSYIMPTNTQSGINLTLKIKTKKSAEKLCDEAKSLGLLMIPLSELTDQETTSLIFYYSKLPLTSIDSSIKEVLQLWQTN
ncbi:MAG: PLP-dependent aminotransferase family protein [Firmicutes bacterium]|nr:PLP-dependent aminotransferase family protein [Bacillota bacterium]